MSLFIRLIILIWILVPLVIGIPLCLRNKAITGWFKAGWISAFLFGGMLAFFIYLAIYNSHKKE